MVLDAEVPPLLGQPPDHTLDALVFSSPAPAPAAVYVAGRRTVVPAGAASRFQSAMRELWA
jgi:hypothetical protein